MFLGITQMFSHSLQIITLQNYFKVLVYFLLGFDTIESVPKFDVLVCFCKP